jgi:D-alanyl-lipoteichoic acid acyltransferase DltB (MBOAT superfamily)
MLFNSIDFAIFLPIVFALYWIVAQKPLQLQNTLIVIASYVFYGWWDWRFLALIFFTSCLDFFMGKGLSNTDEVKKRKAFLLVSIITDLSILGFFKYFNFFQDNFITAFRFFGFNIQANSLHIILPVGVSFYTFQSLSYTIDVYRRKLEPARNLTDYLAFVSFFPQLVAGPIERATNLLPQFYQKRTFEYDKAVDGMRQILWGLFKKIAIADNCAIYANLVFNNSSEYSGSNLLVGAIFFAFQIYGDFSGYSDIAIGTARLFGFNLRQNFAFPYFSRDIAEFWRRWHISLTTWFRDYLYIPFGGSRGGKWKKIRNTFIIFIVSGFWHGANWTFIVWGVLNALCFLPLLLTKHNRKNLDIVAAEKNLPSVKEFFGIAGTFTFTVFAWIFFRAASLGNAFNIISEIFSPTLFTIPDIISNKLDFLRVLSVGMFIGVEWMGRRNQYGIEKLPSFLIGRRRIALRWLFYMGLIVIILFLESDQLEFIYFQF